MHNIYDSTIIRVSGKDAAFFLQSIITNNIDKLESLKGNEQIIYSMLLNHLGKYLFDFFIFKQDDSFMIEIAKEKAEEFIKRLNLYKLRSNVIIEKTNYKLHFSNDFKVNLSFKDPRFEGLRSQELRSKDSALQEVNIRNYILEEEGQGKVDNLYYIEQKYRYSIVDGFIDMEPEKSMVLEYGALELSAIDLKKGCYTGQEVISRTVYQGVVRKKIYKISSDENLDILERNVSITLAEDIEFKLCSSFKNVGIAIVKFKQFGNEDKTSEQTSSQNNNIRREFQGNYNGIGLRFTLAPWYT